MPLYIARSDLDQRFGQAQLAQAAWRDGLDADQVIAAAIAGAGEIIDGYLAGGGYGLPLDPAPALISEIALDIAWYKLWTGAIPDDVATRYKDALRQLADIQSGRLVLQVAGTEVLPADSDSEVLLDAPPRPLQGNMGGY